MGATVNMFYTKFYACSRALPEEGFLKTAQDRLTHNGLSAPFVKGYYSCLLIPELNYFLLHKKSNLVSFFDAVKERVKKYVLSVQFQKGETYFLSMPELVSDLQLS